VVTQTCEQCGTTVASDEQFCPNCGAFIDPMKPHRHVSASGNVISVSSDGNNYEEFSLEDAPPDVEPAPAADRPSGSGKTTPCPSCGAVNPTSNRHCQECGARLDQAPLPTAPRPAVQATAGVRAALAISGLLFIVILVALFFNIFNGDGASPDTTVAAATTTTQSIQEPEPIEIIDQSCTPEGIGSLTCGNLTSGSDSEYQVNWEELSQEEGDITIRLTFRQPMVVTRIDWENIEDPTRFRQNYKARGLIIRADGAITEVPHELENTPGLQTITYATLDANWIEVTIQSAWPAELVEDNIWQEIAIEEITVWGRPANPTTQTTAPDTTDGG
jgi:uncharacterized OB-fold protein